MSSLPDALDPQLAKISELNLPFAVRNDYIIISIPYLDKSGDLARGFLADPLNRVDGVTIGAPANHQMYFIGGEPCGLDGSSLVPWLGGGENRTLIFGENYSSYYFSHKKQIGGVNVEYPDLFSKVKQYAEFISGSTTYKFPNAGIEFLSVDFGDDLKTPFLYPDTHSSHNELNELNTPFRSLSVAIIGVGGTGSYVLDFLSKCPVEKIVLIDDDEFSVKNAYRAPGTSEFKDFGTDKVELYANRYSQFRTGIIPKKGRLTELSSDLLEGVNFAFLCVDYGPSRREACKALINAKIAFIDCGMGLARNPTSLDGMIRTTIVDDASQESVTLQRTLPMQEDAEDAYQTNIQISELNALNAATAVIAFKKEFGFYANSRPSYNSILQIGRLAIFQQDR